MGEWGRQYNLTAKFRGIPGNAPDFVEQVQGRHTSRLGYVGLVS